MSEKTYFKCYELFYRIGKELPVELKAQYYDALMEYGLNGNLPTDPVILSLLQWPIYSIQKTEEQKKQKSEYMKWNKNAVKNFDNILKQRKTENDREKHIERIRNNIEIKENNKENIKEIKKKYLENVFLTDDEYEKLVEKYGKWTIERKIEDLNNYIGSKWKKYKSHYFTILERLRREWAKPLEKKQEKTENNNLDIDTRPEWMKEAFPLNK